VVVIAVVTASVGDRRRSGNDEGRRCRGEQPPAGEKGAGHSDDSIRNA
jgi:hypothetical protein